MCPFKTRSLMSHHPNNLQTPTLHLKQQLSALCSLTGNDTRFVCSFCNVCVTAGGQLWKHFLPSTVWIQSLSWVIRLGRKYLSSHLA